MQNALVMILAGGQGARLFPLSKDRAKPAVPFGGRYRIIDFVLSNIVNSGFYKIKVLTQFKSESLTRHLSLAWHLSHVLGQYIDHVPPQMKAGNEYWYNGSADAVYQNLNLIRNEDCDRVCVFGADHIYKMDLRQMMDYHNQKKADLTIATIPVPVRSACDFGVVEIDRNWKVIGFKEKPKNPKTIPNNPEMALVSMGNYIFNTDTIIKNVTKDSKADTDHDFGKDIIPDMIGKGDVFAYNFNDNIVQGMSEEERGYWRDIGNIDAYWSANMDLIEVSPVFNLYSKEWPIRTYYESLPPAKFVFENKKEGRVGTATDSLVSEGCIISGGQVKRSILSPMVRINSFSLVTDSILMEGVNIGRHAKVKRAVLDKFVNVPSNVKIGYNLEEDSKRFYVSPSGIVVIPKNTNLEKKFGIEN
ncbi:MAG: glucose-1-phosphate adenylyltransferase [Candidatus Anammoxibacter sp.]